MPYQAPTAPQGAGRAATGASTNADPAVKKMVRFDVTSKITLRFFFK
jgi:hypothetical protein